MKSEIILAAEKRNPKDKLSNLRQAGRMPAVYYGRKEKSTPISVVATDFLKVLKKAGESTIVKLKTALGDMESLIYVVDKDPLTGAPRHADFYVFEKGQKIKVKIPLEFTGVAPAIKDMGGVLVKVMHEMEVEATPKDLPHTLAVHIDKLVNFDSRVLAKDIILPEGVALVVNSEEVVASVYEPKEEVVEETPVDLSAIEVEKKGKEAKEGEEGATETAGVEKSPTESSNKGEKKLEKK